MFSLYFPLLSTLYFIVVTYENIYPFILTYNINIILPFWIYLLVNVNQDLKNLIKWVYAMEELQNFNKSQAKFKKVTLTLWTQGFQKHPCIVDVGILPYFLENSQLHRRNRQQLIFSSSKKLRIKKQLIQ